VPAIARGLREAEVRRQHRQAQTQLLETEARFQQVWETTSDALALTDANGIVLAANPAYYELYGFTPEQTIGHSFAIVFPEAQRAELVDQYKRVFASVEAPGPFEAVVRRADGQERVIDSRATFLTSAGRRTAMLSTIRDITERKRAEERIRHQLERLAALRAIDLAITSSLDLNLTLTVFLDQVLTQLGVDAADVLLLDPLTQTLAYAAGRGFRTGNAKNVALRLGEGRAGRAALERCTIIETNMEAARRPSLRTELLGGDAFVSYYGVPLIAKAQVLGVLEIFHRSALQPDPEWLEFLEALAGQAAIAIENARLFDGLQRSHANLSQAYDATIEGWSRALDLRDRETEGHSQRVTELTLRLARAIGMGDMDLVHVRRGALLHDIGKMGIPDHILLKPGPLTDEEWIIMRRHPILAHELLSPIEFLRPALDIPYCHHEKWDGTGYPRRLAGEQIPLAARLFAVVDVWDALRSDRPYRPAWTAERAEAHIRSLAGRHFDPQAVELFFQVVD